MTFEIDLNILSDNFKILKNKTYDISACVKANAYGFGALEITKTLYDLDCKSFCVANIFEGIELRSILPKNIEIICLNGFIDRYADLYISNNITPAVINMEQYFKIQNYKILFWLFIDTGLNRTGIQFKDIDKINTNLNITGILTHFLNTNNILNEEQVRKIDIILEKFPNIKRSIIKSSAICLEKKYKDMARIGHCLYFNTGDNITQNIGKVYSEILSVLYIKKGEGVGYDCKFIADQDMRIAIVNCGYSYGLDKDHKYFYINNEKCQILGKISMDLTVIDISHIENVKIGDFADIFGNFIDSARDIGFSLGYLTAKLSNKINKIYLPKKKAAIGLILF